MLGCQLLALLNHSHLDAFSTTSVINLIDVILFLPANPNSHLITCLSFSKGFLYLSRFTQLLNRNNKIYLCISQSTEEIPCCIIFFGVTSTVTQNLKMFLSQKIRIRSLSILLVKDTDTFILSFYIQH